MLLLAFQSVPFRYPASLGNVFSYKLKVGGRRSHAPHYTLTTVKKIACVKEKKAPTLNTERNLIKQTKYTNNYYAMICIY